MRTEFWQPTRGLMLRRGVCAMRYLVTLATTVYCSPCLSGQIRSASSRNHRDLGRDPEPAHNLCAAGQHRQRAAVGE